MAVLPQRTDSSSPAMTPVNVFHVEHWLIRHEAQRWCYWTPPIHELRADKLHAMAHGFLGQVLGQHVAGIVEVLYLLDVNENIFWMSITSSEAFC